MKILFILNQLPFPPRNGVTIPTYNYLVGLSRYAEVSLLFLRDSVHEWTEEGIEENRRLVRNLWVMDVNKQPAGRRILNEVAGKSFFHIGRQYDRGQLGTILEEHSFDVVLVSDDGILDAVNDIQDLARSTFIAVVGLNDCITAVFKQARHQVLLSGGTLKDRIRFLIKWIRSFRAGAIEARLLRSYDVILVQSSSDREYLERISRRNLADRILITPNGVESSLFDNAYDSESRELLFVGSLRGYSRIVEWLLLDVWPAVHDKHPDAVFHIVGKGASPALKELIATRPGVKHTEYVPNITEIYRDKAVSVSPVFKDYGLINKVVESMAAGVPIIADEGSFGCVPDFVDGTHGIVANDARSMIDAIDRLLDSRELRLSISRNARSLAQRHFVWEERIDAMHARILSLLEGPTRQMHK